MSAKRVEWEARFIQDNPHMPVEVAKFTFDTLFDYYTKDEVGFNKWVKRLREEDRRRVKIERNLKDAGHSVPPKPPMQAVFEGVEVLKPENAPKIEVHRMIEEGDVTIDDVTEEIDNRFRPFTESNLGITSC